MIQKIIQDNDAKKYILFIFITLGAFLIVISRAENLWLFFFGLGTSIAAGLTLIIKKYAHVLILPTLVLLGTSLLLFNNVDFLPNSVKTIFVEPRQFVLSLILINQNTTQPSRKLQAGLISPGLNLVEASKLEIVFERRPDLINHDFVLQDYLIQADQLNTSWYWSGDPTFVPLMDYESLIINDPILVDQIPRDGTHLHIIERLEFHLYKKDQTGTIQTHKVPIGDVHYLSQSAIIDLQSSLDWLRIEYSPEIEILSFDVRVNGYLLIPQDKGVDWQSFTTFDEIKQIHSIEITEAGRTLPFAVQTLQPAFTSIYIGEAHPQPILIEAIELVKFFPRLNRSLSVTSWGSKDLLSVFSPIDAEMRLEQGIAFVHPQGFEPNLIYQGEASEIAARVTEQMSSLMLTGNSLLTAFFLIMLTLSSLFFNHSDKTILPIWRFTHKHITKARECYSTQWLQALLTPFNLLLFIFLLLSWGLILGVVSSSLLIAAALILSLILFYYILQGTEVK